METNDKYKTEENRSQKNLLTIEEHEEQKQEHANKKDKMRSGVARAVWIFVGLSMVPVGVAYFTDCGQFLRETANHVTERVAFSLFITSINCGLVTDTDQQKKIYTTAPLNGRIPLEIYVYMAFLVGMMVWLWYSLDKIPKSGLCLTTLVLGNAMAWHYWMKPAVSDSIETSRDAYLKTGKKEKEVVLELWVQYINGNWQWARFGVAFMIALGMCLFGTVQIPSAAAQIISGKLKLIGIANHNAFAILFFVCVFEGWIWVQRIIFWGGCKCASRVIEIYEPPKPDKNAEQEVLIKGGLEAWLRRLWSKKSHE